MASLQSKVSIPSGVLYHELSGEAVVLNLESGKYYGLDETGTRMWVLLSEHGCLEPAYRALLNEYDANAEQLKEDLLKLTDELAAHGLLRILDDA
jgi:hypothetical protein